ncbi:MAG: hypothetical protein FWH14_01225 [Oscillospiraceae bacterium]|nr:hypothetical protein [Oscillospiraceae bacterium]
MSILGMFFFAALILIFVLVFTNKLKTGILLFVLYLILFPFTILYLSRIFAIIFNDIIGLLVFYSLICSPFIFGIGLRILNMLKDRKDPVIKILKSKQLKLIFCSVLLLVLIQIEFFSGIETFQDKKSYFKIRSEIGIGHWLPYSLHAEVHYNSGNVIATYWGESHPTPEWRCHIYLYNGELYWRPIPRYFINFFESDDESPYPPSEWWERWGIRGSYT